MLVLLLATYLLEMLLFTIPWLWAGRRYYAFFVAGLISFATGGLLASDTSIIMLVIALISAYRVLNHLRIVENRMHTAYLLRSVRRSAFVLAGAQAVSLALLVTGLQFDRRYLTNMFALLQFGAAAVLLAVTIRNIRKTRSKLPAEYFTDKELPTVSVLIPARNETRDLEECLRSVLASDYPKLEVIVFDDCSHDKTSEIIRSFAQDGVRFIKGAEPDKHWLAKNRAYEQLSKEASGDLLLFCGVDVRLGAQAIRALVTAVKERSKSMISVMPRRLDSTVHAAFIQPMRYWWELALPRRFFNRPPVLSSCWLIKHDALKKLGGFAAVSRAIMPEQFFARELVASDGYSFIRADTLLDVTSVKSLRRQRQTAVRVRYPQLHRRPENMLLLTILELSLLLGPFLMLPSAFFGIVDISAALPTVSCLLLIASHVSIVAVSNPANVPVALLNFPLVVLTDMYLSYASMFKYEFSVVEWKGRNICIPVMYVSPRLPAIPEK